MWLKPKERTAFKPSAEADGKREPAAWQLFETLLSENVAVSFLSFSVLFFFMLTDLQPFTL
ncbi:hypothetical protein [Parabacteroides goldsteinii]|uniref:hypothetical protein n=1 Tax=Parabacteroides goldsteinii TaxID=328812 RepID=UPI0005C445FA|nr:hypothetical protein [Parabacteroides goldsteinii]